LVEEQRLRRFDERSPFRAAEASADIEERIRETPQVDAFLEEMRRERRLDPAADELVQTWTLSLDRLEDARDLLFERFYEWAVVASATAVEVFVRGLLKYHARTHIFRGNPALGETLLKQIMDNNGFRGVIPKMVQDAWGVNLRKDPDWKSFQKLVEGRDIVVHTGVETNDESALLAVYTCLRVIRRIAELVEHHPRLERTGGFLSSHVAQSLSDLEDDLAVAAEHIFRKRPSTD
jgi:hypothetical protein